MKNSEVTAIGLATGDDYMCERIDFLAQKSTIECAELLFSHRREIQKQREKLERKIEALVTDSELLATILLHRMAEDRAEAIPHPSLDIHIETNTKLEKNIPELLKLEGVVPESELRAAISLVQPEPEYKADARKLQALGKKYGKIVTDILDRGLVHVVSGKPKLIIQQRIELERAA